MNEKIKNVLLIISLILLVVMTLMLVLAIKDRNEIQKTIQIKQMQEDAIAYGSQIDFDSQLKSSNNVFLVSKSLIVVKSGTTRVIQAGIKNLYDTKMRYQIQINSDDNKGDWLKYVPDYRYVDPKEMSIIGIAINPPDDSNEGKYLFEINLINNSQKLASLNLTLFVIK